MILSALCLEVELFTMALLKTINAALYGSTLRDGLLERFSLSGNIISRNATPKIYTPSGTTKTYYYPSTSFNVGLVPSSDTVSWRATLVEDEAYFLRALFPEGTTNDDGTFETPKDFTAENAGGESVAVSDFIDSIEIAGPIFNIPIELELLSESSTTSGGVKTETQYFKGEYSSSIIPGFDTSKPLINQFLSGTFNGLVTAETATYHILYNKELITPATWEDGAYSVTYSPYCVLTPVNVEFKNSMHVNFRFKADLKAFTINIKNYYNARNYAPFYHVKY